MTLKALTSDKVPISCSSLPFIMLMNQSENLFFFCSSVYCLVNDFVYPTFIDLVFNV